MWVKNRKKKLIFRKVFFHDRLRWFAVDGDLFNLIGTKMMIPTQKPVNPRVLFEDRQLIS
jgi:hypothetical protein